MTAPRRTAAYNPGILAKDELIATFSARGPLLATLLDDVRRGGKQHHLIVGQRGAGKTTLLLRLAYAIEDDAELAGRAMPLRFPEEQYNVGHLSDFWLNCVDALTDTLEQRGDIAAARKLDAEVDRLEELDEDERARASLALLTGWAQRERRLLVLLVDNLDLILERLPEQHWPLREVLSADNRLMLVGASSSFIQESFDYGKAFYDFFHVHELAALSEDEARAMLEHLADATGAPHIREVLAEPGRFAALHLLSGGMPRTLVLLHRILASGTSTRAEDDLEALLDQVTPYYKARFDELPTQSQLVVHALAMNWHPMTAIECATQARIDINAVSSQLNRLVRQGLVRKLPSADSSKLSFLIAERFFAIWYSMRASRRLRRNRLWYVELVQAIYGQREVERRAQELLASCDVPGVAGDPARLLAYASKISDTRVRAKLEFRAVQALAAAGVVGGALADLLDVDGEDRHLVPILDRLRSLSAVHASLATAERSWSAPLTPMQLADLVRRSEMLSLQQKCVFAAAVVIPQQGSATTDVKRAVAVSKSLERVIETLTLMERDPDSQSIERFLDAIGRGELPSLPDFSTRDEVERSLALVPDEPWRTMLLRLIIRSARSLADSAVDAFLRDRPNLAADLISGAAASIRSGIDVTVGLLQRALRVQTEASSLYLASAALWRPFAQAGIAAQVADLLHEYGWHERLLPLYEALRAAGEGRRGELLHLAPEVRRPAEEMLAELLAEDQTEQMMVGKPYGAPVGKASRAAEPRPKLRPVKAPTKKTPRKRTKG